METLNMKVKRSLFNFSCSILQDVDRHILFRTSLTFINSTTFHAATQRIALHDYACFWIVCDQLYTNFNLQLFSQTLSLKRWKTFYTFIFATGKAWDVEGIPILPIKCWYTWHSVSFPIIFLQQLPRFQELISIF